MYPVLNKARVRGGAGDFYLQGTETGNEFVLEELHAQILWHCNGEHSLEWLSSNFFVTSEDLRYFLDIIQGEGMLHFNDEAQKIDFPPLQKGPPLLEAQMEITGRCNLWCKHCYGRQDFKEVASQDLSLAELLDFIDQASSMNISRCFLSGGEAFLRDDLPELISYLAQKSISIGGIFTNGTIYREDVIDALRHNGVKATFLVSVDGPFSEIHDFVRGKGNFDKTVSFIKKTIDAGFRVTVNTVAMKQNVRHLMDMRQMLERLGVSRWRISVPREQGETIVNHEVIVPRWEEIFDAYKQLLLHTLGHPEGMKIQLSSIFKTEFLEEGKYYLYPEKSSCCEYKKYSLVLRPNGDILSCPASLNFPLGNIREKSLEEIWHSALVQTFKTLPIIETECRDCRIRKYCGSGCRISAWKAHNDFMAKDTNACPLYEFFAEVVEPILREYGIEAEFLDEAKESKYDLSLLPKREIC